MSVRMFLGDVRVDAVAPDDRGLAYGESLFETMRAHRGKVHWWEAHMARLAQGAAVLLMPLPDLARVAAEASALLDGGDGVLKLQLTRGGGGRGYAACAGQAPFWMLSRHPLPAATDALDVVWCETRLARQPLLAGIKHGNRLEQVLARSEVETKGADEGLVRDVAGRVTSGTATNVFIHDGRGWHTPELDHAGVAGICRGWLLQESEATVRRIRVDEVETAEAVFLCNAVRGILPVRRLGDRVWPSIHPDIRVLQLALGRAHPGFVTRAPATQQETS